MRAYILLRQSQLSPEDRKKVVLEQQGNLEYLKVCSAVRLLGSKFFSELQGTRSSKTKVYDVHYVEEPDINEDGEKAFQASASILQSEEPDPELDQEFVDALAASEDADALTVQQFEEELESFFQETPSLQEVLLGYVEARSRLLAKRKARGFWPVTKGAGKPHQRFGKGSGKSKGKHAREQLLARIARSTCRACGERGHWKAECPKLGRGSSSSKEATTTVAQVDIDEAMAADHDQGLEVHDELPAGTQSLDEAFVVIQESHACEIKERLRLLAEKTRKFQNQKIP